MITEEKSASVVSGEQTINFGGGDLWVRVFAKRNYAEVITSSDPNVEKGDVLSVREGRVYLHAIETPDDFWLPPGFSPVFSYKQRNGYQTEVAEVQEGCCRTKVDAGFLVFAYSRETYPKLPLKAHGELWHMGWDIPSQWAIDTAGQAWIDNAHGHPMEVTTPEALVSEAENETERNHLRELLGLFLEPPAWHATARREGWVELPVTCILVMLVPGTDQVYLSTLLPSGFPPDVEPNPATLRFEVPSGTGLQYVQKHLAHKWPNARIEVLDTTTGERTVIQDRS